MKAIVFDRYGPPDVLRLEQVERPEPRAAPERAFARKPAGVSFEDAAATPMAGMTALQALRDHARVQPGHRVLIVGASGGVGTFAVQFARLLGADVTAVCSTGKAGLALRLGADRVIDYTQEDFARSHARYHAVLAVNGSRSIWDYRRVLTPDGRYLVVGGDWPQIRDALLLGPLLSCFGPKKLGPCEAKASPADLAFLGESLEQGRIKPVIDRRYPLREVPDAIRYVEAGHAVGKVIIVVGGTPAQ